MSKPRTPHEPDCSYTGTPAEHCRPCHIARAAYQRGREDAAKPLCEPHAGSIQTTPVTAGSSTRRLPSPLPVGTVQSE